MIRLWRNAWTELIPFLDYDIEMRKVFCSTNAIESLNARYRRAVGQKVISRPSRPPQVPAPCDPQPGPGPGLPRPMDDALETRDQRLRHHFGDRWPDAETY